MAHTIVAHVDHNDDIPHDHEHGVHALTQEFVSKLKNHGHDVEHAHVHRHDHAHHEVADKF
jgi:hypothetical protein